MITSRHQKSGGVKWGLGEAEDVAVGVVEPGDAGAAGGGPDGEGMSVVHAWIAEELDTGMSERGDGGLDVRDLPAEHGEGLGCEGLDAGDAEGDAGRLKDKREGISSARSGRPRTDS